MVDPAPSTSLRPNDRLEHAILSAWMEAANTGLCVIDDTSRIVMLNPAACQLLGVEGLQVLGAPLSRVIADVNFVGGASVTQWLATPGFDGDKQVSREGASGLLHLLLKSQTLRTAEGNLFKMVAITDVTQLLAAQQTVDSESSRRQWEAMNAGVVIADARQPDMPIVYVNQKFEEMSGYCAADVVGRNCRFLQGAQSDASALDSIRTAIKTQSNGYALLRNFRKDGTLFLNELFISPIRNSSGVVTHFLGIQHVHNNGAGFR